MLEKLADREREIDHLQAQLDKLRRMNFGSRSEKISRHIAQMEADLNRLQKESDTLTGRVEIVEDRYEQSSTIVVSQFPVDKWYGLMENPTTADAILDRLVHNTHRLVLQGESMRKNKQAVVTKEKTG